MVKERERIASKQSRLYELVERHKCTTSIIDQILDYQLDCRASPVDVAQICLMVTGELYMYCTRRMHSLVLRACDKA